MLIQTAEHRHNREVALVQPGAWWPRNALDLWWRTARGHKDPEMHALHVLEGWRDHATYRLAGGLFLGDMNNFLMQTGAWSRAKVLDRVSVSALCAMSAYRRLRANYTGPAFKSTTDYYFKGDTADWAGLIATTGGGTAAVDTLYDQTANAFNITAGSTARPNAITSGTVQTMGANNIPCFTFDGVNDVLSRADAMGLSGSPALTVVTANTLVSLAASAVAWNVGGTANNASYGQLYNGTDQTNVYAWQNSSHREFAVSGAVSSARRWIFQRAVNSTPSAYTVSEDTTALTQSGISNGGTALNIPGASVVTALGSYVALSSLFTNMKSNMIIYFNSTALVQGDLNLLDIEMSRHM